MKKLSAVLVCAALCSFPAFADNGWGVYGSYWSPADGEETIGPAAIISMEMIPSVQFELRGAYHSNILGDGDGEKLNATPLEGGLTYKRPVGNALSLYGGGGAGYYFFSGDADAKDELGFYGVAGIEYDVRKNNVVYGSTRSSLFAEVMYRSIKPDLDSGETVDLSGIAVSVGLMLYW